MKRYAVKSTFGPTIQGEGLNTGRSCHFLRFAGCNAWDGRKETKAKSACPYCDTDFYGGDRLTINEIVSRFDGVDERSGLVITGGEPLLQMDQELIDTLSADFAWVDVETNGTVAQKFVRPPRVNISCSPKRIKDLPIVVSPDWWKILIPHQKHFMTMALESGLPIYVQPVMFDSTEHPSYWSAVAECLKLCHEYPRIVRLSVQVHKVVGAE